MPVKILKIPFIRRRRRPASAQPSPPAVLTLVSATYDPDVSVRLVFNKPINISQMQTKNIGVNDGQFEGKVYQGVGGGTLVNPTTVDIDLSQASGDIATGVHLTADGNTAITSIDGTETWAGVNFLELPFP